MRAAVKNIKSGDIVQGGSTITQQLVRNLYIGKEVSLDRKIKEACLALKVEDAHTKDWILASYLNQVYFGNHAYGVEAAAQTYFSKHAADLNLVQAALIAGLPAGALDLRPVPAPGRGAWPAETKCSARCTRPATSRRSSTRRRSPSRSSSSAATSTRGSASRTSSATCASS